MTEPLQLPAPEKYKDWRILSEDEKQGEATGEELKIANCITYITSHLLKKGNKLEEYKDCIIIVPPDYGKQQEPERNADRDSKEDMKAVQDKYGVGSIERLDDGVWLAFHKWDFDAPVKCYRITAKHAKVFDPKTMDAEMFARAAIGAGDMLKVTDGNKTRWCTSCDSVSVWHNRAQYSYPYFAWIDLLVERKTRAEYEQEIAKNEPARKPYHQITHVLCSVGGREPSLVPIAEVRRQLERVE